MKQEQVITFEVGDRVKFEDKHTTWYGIVYENNPFDFRVEVVYGKAKGVPGGTVVKVEKPEFDKGIKANLDYIKGRVQGLTPEAIIDRETAETAEEKAEYEKIQAQLKAKDEQTVLEDEDE